MKKTLMAVLCLLCTATMATGLASCGVLGGGTTGGNSSSSSSSSAPIVTYTLNKTDYGTVKFGASLDASALKLNGSDGSSVAVTAAMTDWNTNSVGNKTLTVSYKGATVGTVSYTVKYEVKFAVNGEVIDTQMVLSKDEIKMPADPEVAGMEFTGWAMPDTLTGNATIVAQFEGVVTEPGTLSVVSSEGEESDTYVFAHTADDFLSLETSYSDALSENDYEVQTSNNNLVVTKGEDILLIYAEKSGVTELTVTTTDNNGYELSVTKTIVVKPQSFLINAKELPSGAIEDVYALGSMDVNKNVVTHDLTLSLGVEAGIGEGLKENIVWESNSTKASVVKDASSQNGKVTLATTGEAEPVEFTAKFIVDGEVYGTSKYEVRCVYEGVNVGTYNELVKATKAGDAVVLTSNIEFPKVKAEIDVIEMQTTYDDQYYKNLDETEPDKEHKAMIKTLIQFRNDVHGNGFTVNAHNATIGLLNATGDPIFAGPLNFVAMANSGSSAISVKGQDNVCFAVFEGVTLNNVELKGCDLIPKDGMVDLTDLNYAGTTVEVFGDNVTIQYSRITNGRTVLRIFGDANDASKVIHVDIKNSVLKGAREFILRMGSNCFVDSETEYSPNLPGDTGTAYNTKLNYNSLSAAEKEAYDEKYIKTFVNIENSVFQDAGIFAIGIDSHFSGEALDRGNQFTSVLGAAAANWKELAKTSYGAKLTFQGEVKMYTWKLLDDIDSSTLIEINGNPNADDDEEDNLTAALEFDVGAMVRHVCTKEGSDLASIIATKGEGENALEYVHAGIAFFGGGKNYGVFENAAGNALTGFEVSLADVQKGFLTAAAGTENFYFLLYSNESSFTYDVQEKELVDGTMDKVLKGDNK